MQLHAGWRTQNHRSKWESRTCSSLVSGLSSPWLMILGSGLMLKERGLWRRELQAAKREALFYENTWCHCQWQNKVIEIYPLNLQIVFLILFWLHSNHRRLVSQMTAKSSNWSSMLIVLTTCALHQSNTLDLWIEPMLSRFRWPPAEASSFNHSKDRPWSNCPRASADLLKERLRPSTPLACGVSMLKDHPQTESWWSSSY